MRAVRFCGGVDTSGTELKRKGFALLAFIGSISPPSPAALRRQGCWPRRIHAAKNLFADDYFCLLLFGLFNPALKSMRARFAMPAAGLKKCAECVRPPAARPHLFPEGQHAFEPEILAKMVRELARESKRPGRSLATRAEGRLSSASRRWTAPCCGRLTAWPGPMWDKRLCA